MHNVCDACLFELLVGVGAFIQQLIENLKDMANLILNDVKKNVEFTEMHSFIHMHIPNYLYISIPIYTNSHKHFYRLLIRPWIGKRGASKSCKL